MKKLTLSSFILYLFLFACDTPNSSMEDNKKDNLPEKAIAFDLGIMDTTANPCDNFYQYAVGGWLANNPIPSTESRWSSFNIVTEENNLKLKAILEEFSNQKNEDGSMEQKLGDFYTSIMDSTHIEELGYEPIQEELDKVNSIESKEDLITLIAKHHSIRVGSLFGLYVGQDDKISDQYVIKLSQGGLGLPDRDYYTKDDEKSKEIQEAYIHHISNVFNLINKENSQELAQKAYEIESILAEASMTNVERRVPENLYNKMSVEKLEDSYQNIDWTAYFSTVNLSKFDSVIISQPNFFVVVNDLINTLSIDEWKTYLEWKVLRSFSAELSSDFVNENFNFYGKTLSGTQELKPLWQRAIGKMNGSIGELLGKAFVERHFSKEAKADVGQMVENLRSAFQERILQLEWMSEDTKKEAIKKLQAFKYKIGYPDEWKDYTALEITADNKVSNLINARKFNFKEMTKKLGNPIDPNEWFMNPHTVNAYYASSKNEIVFPAGILQPPFYNVDFDHAINYGGIGAVIGHEFTHGFDDRGSKYDSEGNLKNWWTEDDRQRFESRAQKVVEQFNSFEPLDSLFVNGELTLGENIADLGGVTLAYYALLKDIEKVGGAEDIDGFTFQQRFFLGWAQVWHMNMTDEEMRKRISTDPHSPGEYRVNGPLSNMSEFQEAFSCKSGSFMVNDDSTKAVIW